MYSIRCEKTVNNKNVTNDKHFDVLKTVALLKLTIINLKEFAGLMS